MWASSAHSSIFFNILCLTQLLISKRSNLPQKIAFPPPPARRNNHHTMTLCKPQSNKNCIFFDSIHLLGSEASWTYLNLTASLSHEPDCSKIVWFTGGEGEQWVAHVPRRGHLAVSQLLMCWTSTWKLCEEDRNCAQHWDKAKDHAVASPATPNLGTC